MSRATTPRGNWPVRWNAWHSIWITMSMPGCGPMPNSRRRRTPFCKLWSSRATRARSWPSIPAAGANARTGCRNAGRHWAAGFSACRSRPGPACCWSAGSPMAKSWPPCKRRGRAGLPSAATCSWRPTGPCLGGLAALLARCQLFIGHDSGISHLAAAVGVPCVLLFGPTDPDIWAPLRPGVIVVRSPNETLPGLPVETVRAAVANALKIPVGG